MTKMRFDPTFVEHERWEHLGADALVLHLTAVAFTVRTSSDGVLTMARVATLTPLVTDPREVAQRLLDEGLWTAVGDGQVRVCMVHDDLRRADGRGDEQPSKTFVDGERRRAQERKEKWRNARRNVDRNDPGNDPWNEEGNAVPPAGGDPSAARNAQGNAVPIGVGNATQWSTDQSSAEQEPPAPATAPHDTGTTCHHDTPDGLLPTKVGTPRCLQCRQEQATTPSAAAT